MNINISYLRSVSGILKIVEMVTVLIALLVMRFTDFSQGNGVVIVENVDKDVVYIGVGVMFACLLVTPLLFITYLMGKMEIQNTVFEFSMNFLFFFFLAIYGVIALIDSTDLPKGSVKDCAITTGVFALIAAATYLGDTVMAVINYRS